MITKFQIIQKQLILLSFIGFVFVTLTGCGDFITEPSTSDFSSAGCNSLYSEIGVDKEQYLGLSCISYALAEQQHVRIDLVNYPCNCTGPYEGYYKVTNSNFLEIQIEKKDCEDWSRCACLYDFSLKIEGLDTNSLVDTTILNIPCPEEGPINHHTILDMTATNQGVQCSYWGDERGLHGPCYPGNLNECADDLICSPSKTVTNEYLCLKKCVEISDCPIPNIFTCDEGVCRLSNPIES